MALWEPCGYRKMQVLVTIPDTLTVMERDFHTAVRELIDCAKSEVVVDIMWLLRKLCRT